MHRIKHTPRPFGRIVFSRWCSTKFVGERSYGEACSIGLIPKRFSVSDKVEGKKLMDHSTVGFSMSRRSWWEKAPAMLNGISLLPQARNVQLLASRCTSNCFGTQEDSWMIPSFARTFASNSNSQSSRASMEKERKDISTVQDPFEDLTYNIPEKPVTFTEGASYSLVILAGLGIAGVAGYAVCKELIFEPKEYTIFGKALERVQNDSQVRVRIGSPITGYGNESRNRAARQRIPNKPWTDEDGVERVEVNFYIRGPHGVGKVYTEMFKDKTDKNWKFTYLIVEITSPSRVQLMLESYVPL